MKSNREEIYKYTNPRGYILRLISIPGQRPYRGGDYSGDRIICIEIEAPNGGSLNMAYPVDFLFAMWEAVFKVWVKPEKKAKYAERFMRLIRTKLQPGHLNL